MPTLDIQENVSLQRYTTLRLPVRARWFVTLEDAALLPRAFARQQGSRPVLVLGGGSNCLFVNDYDGLVVRLANRGIDVLDDTADTVRIKVAAGENWHAFVRWSLQQGYAGLENLALIPGTVGAAPIQNIGAYGVEVEDFIESVDTWLPDEHRHETVPTAACAFAYRDSVFKQNPGERIITAVTFRLLKQPRLRLDYAGLRERLDTLGIHQPSPTDVADVVETLRREKLPDPAQLGNAGSFFKNPFVTRAECDRLLQAHPGMPHFHQPGDDTGRIKLSAGWLIEAAGMKGYREGDAGIAEGHALVVVNHGNATGEQLWTVARTVQESVEQRFGILLEPEPRIY